MIAPDEIGELLDPRLGLGGVHAVYDPAMLHGGAGVCDHEDGLGR